MDMQIEAHGLGLWCDPCLSFCRYVFNTFLTHVLQCWGGGLASWPRGGPWNPDSKVFFVLFISFEKGLFLEFKFVLAVGKVMSGPWIA